MKKLIVHAGNYKTGSTAIQHFMDINRERFSEAGIYIPSTGAEIGAVHEWARMLAGRLEQSVENELKQRIVDEVSTCNHNTILISSEIFFPGRVAKELQELFPDFEIIFICYLRRQDHFLSAFYQQLIKHPRFKESSPPELHSLLSRDAAKYYNSLLRWRDVVGEKNMSVNVYEKGQLENGLIEHFMGAVGLSYDDSWMPAPRVNETIHSEFLEFLRLANSQSLSNEEHMTLLDALSAISANIKDECYFHKSNVFSPMQRREILDLVASDNSKIAREFLGREDGILFYENSDISEEWTSPVLTTDTLAQIIAGLWIGHQSRLMKLADIHANDVVTDLMDKNAELQTNIADLYHDRGKVYKELEGLYKEREDLLIERGELYESINSYRKRFGEL